MPSAIMKAFAPLVQLAIAWGVLGIVTISPCDISADPMAPTKAPCATVILNAKELVITTASPKKRTSWRRAKTSDELVDTATWPEVTRFLSSRTCSKVEATAGAGISYQRFIRLFESLTNAGIEVSVPGASLDAPLSTQTACLGKRTKEQPPLLTPNPTSWPLALLRTVRALSGQEISAQRGLTARNDRLRAAPILLLPQMSGIEFRVMGEQPLLVDTVQQLAAQLPKMLAALAPHTRPCGDIIVQADAMREARDVLDALRILTQHGFAEAHFAVKSPSTGSAPRP